MIDLNAVTVLNGDASVLRFPVTARLDSFGVVPGTMHLHTTGTSSWPSVAIDQSGALVQAATLWVFCQIGGRWYGSGAERLRPDQLNGTKPNAHAPFGGLRTLIGNGWFAKHDPPLNGYNPADGEIIGVMVVAGDTRLGRNTPVQARTDLVCVAYTAGEAMREAWRGTGWDAVPVPGPSPTPTPIPTPTPTSDPAIVTRLEARVLALETAEADRLAEVAELRDRAADLEQRLAALKVPTHTQPTSIRAFGFSFPVGRVPLE